MFHDAMIWPFFFWWPHGLVSLIFVIVIVSLIFRRRHYYYYHPTWGWGGQTTPPPRPTAARSALSDPRRPLRPAAKSSATNISEKKKDLRRLEPRRLEQLREFGLASERV